MIPTCLFTLVTFHLQPLKSLKYILLCICFLLISVKASSEYDTAKYKAFVYDLTSEHIPHEIAPNSIDIIIVVFVLSAIPPHLQSRVFSNLYTLLKPNGLVHFRDYGKYDMTQLRLKKGRYLSESFYCRGDGTQVYYFEEDEVCALGREAGFDVVSSGVDRRLLVNRLKQLKMYRIWVQCTFRKKAI